MNERITVIEEALAILRTARLAVVNVNPVAYEKLLHAGEHLTGELRAMVSE